MADPTRLEAVRDVLERHREDILRAFRATGVAIGKQDLKDASYVLVVYLASAADRPAHAEPIEGVPLKFVVTGTFKPLA
jgi:hypothetical protein